MGSIPIGSANGAAPAEAGLARRLAAGVYDAALIIAIWMLAALLVALARHGAPVPPGNLPFRLLLLALAGAFLAGFWMRGGQTLGMRAWRLKVEACAGGPPGPVACLVRLGVLALTLATLGLGYAWIWLDRDGRPLHDRLAGTRVLLLPPRERHG